MRLDYSNKTALVTGGSRGIGRRIAADLLSCGAEVIVTSTRAEDGAPLVRELGGNVRHIQVDFSDHHSTRGFLDRIRALPALHVCVNNAGTTQASVWFRAYHWSILNAAMTAAVTFGLDSGKP